MAERVRNKYSICAAPQATTVCLFPQNSPHSGIYRSARGMDEVKKEIVRRTIPFYLHFFGTQHRIKGPQHRQHILRADGFAAAQGDEGDQRRFFRRFRLNNIHILRF